MSDFKLVKRDTPEARKIRWLRGMLRWAVRLAKVWRFKDSSHDDAHWRALALGDYSEVDRLTDEVEELTKENTDAYAEIRFLREQIEHLPAENAALRQAGRGLYVTTVDARLKCCPPDWGIDQLDAWRKVDHD